MMMPSVLDVDDIQRITSDYFGGHKCWRGSRSSIIISSLVQHLCIV